MKEKHVAGDHGEAVFALDKAKRGEKKDDGCRGKIKGDGSHEIISREFATEGARGRVKRAGATIETKDFDESDRGGDSHENVAINRKRHEVIPALDEEVGLAAVSTVDNVDNGNDDGRNEDNEVKKDKKAFSMTGVN